MGACSDKEPLASPRNFFPGRKRRVAELLPKFLGRSFLAFSHFAAVDHHIVRVVLSLDLDLAKFHQSCFHNLNVLLASRSFKAIDTDSKDRLKRKSLIRVPKRSQLFIRTHNETLPVAAMCVGNEDCRPLAFTAVTHGQLILPERT